MAQNISAQPPISRRESVCPSSTQPNSVLNTDSIQLIPANVAAVRGALGCGTPFDILPAVWVTSCCSAGLGVTAAWVLGTVWRK